MPYARLVGAAVCLSAATGIAIVDDKITWLDVIIFPLILAACWLLVDETVIRVRRAIEMSRQREPREPQPSVGGGTRS